MPSPVSKRNIFANTIIETPIKKKIKQNNKTAKKNNKQ